MVLNKVTHGVEEQENGTLPKKERVVIEEKVSELFSKREEMDDHQNASEWNVIQWWLEGPGDDGHDDGAGLRNCGL